MVCMAVFHWTAVSLRVAKNTGQCGACNCDSLMASTPAAGEVKGEWCPKFPSLPLVGKVSDKKPLPTFQSRVDEAGNVEVYV